jgi:hypothetical protein
VEASQGHENTPAVILDTGVVKDNWGVSVALQAIRTNGYILIPRDQRGSVDTAAGNRSFRGIARIAEVGRGWELLYSSEFFRREPIERHTLANE